MFLGLGLQPHGGAVAQQHIESCRVRDDTARRGNHHVAVNLHGLFQRPAFIAAVCASAIQVVDLAHAAARHALNFLIEFEKRHIQLLCQHASQRGLSCAAQAHQRNTRAAMRISTRRSAQNFGGGHAHAVHIVFAAAFQQLAQQQPFGAGGGHIAQQLCHAALQRQRYLVQDQDRDIARAVLQVGQMPL